MKEWEKLREFVKEFISENAGIKGSIDVAILNLLEAIYLQNEEILKKLDKK